jgi:hypothetical protein
MMSGSRALLTDWPDRHFLRRPWKMPGGGSVFAFVSKDFLPVMVAIDLDDAQRMPSLSEAVSQMRAGIAPFQNAREVRSGVIGRYLVVEIGD